ncbi:MAG: M91 family zinc metallopeptidase [Kofleriaceae bacterium]
MKQTAHDAVAGVGSMFDDLGSGLADEGLLGLADPIGMLDRQDAKRDLAPYFGIVDEDFEGYRNHDQVTQEQFDEIAGMYSDIRLGRGDLTINTDKYEDADAAGAYREDVMGDEAWGAKDHRIYFQDPGQQESVPDNADHIMLAHEMEHARQHITDTQPEGDYGVPGDDYYTENSERATVGLAHSDAAHPADPSAPTENRIRWELNQLGEDWLPRTHYDVSFEPVAGMEHNDKKRNAAWREFLTSLDHPGFD